MKANLQVFNPKGLKISIFQDFGSLIIELQAIALRFKNCIGD
jgi:hypothetical protein